MLALILIAGEHQQLLQQSFTGTGKPAHSLGV